MEYENFSVENIEDYSLPEFERFIKDLDLETLKKLLSFLKDNEKKYRVEEELKRRGYNPDGSSPPSSSPPRRRP